MAMKLEELIKNKLEWQGQRVLTTKQLAQAYNCDYCGLNKKVRAHSDIFVEGKNYFDLSGDTLKEFKSRDESGTVRRMKSLRLFTKSGAKIQAELSKYQSVYDAYKWLEENYFGTADNTDVAPIAEISAPAETSADSALQIYVNDAFGKIRALMIDGEPYFVGKDVATALGYEKPLNALKRHVDEDDSLKQGLTDSLGRQQETILINESGLYSLILSSKLESAKAFKRWVTSEVLPSIRKTGEYKANPTPTPAPLEKTPAEMVLEVGKTRDAIKNVFGVGALKEGIALAKSIDMVGKHYNTDLSELNAFLPPATHKVGHLTATDIGKNLGMSAQAVNEKLKAMGLQYKDKNGKWILTDSGVGYGEMIPYVNKYSGHTGYYPLWNDSVLNLLDDNFILPF